MIKSLFLGVLLIITSSSLFSHQRSESYSSINIDRNEEDKVIQVEFSLQTSVLQKLYSSYSINWEAELAEEVINGFTFNQSCEITSEPFLKNSSTTGYVTLFWNLLCGPEETTINYNLFFDKDSSHTHISTFIINSAPNPEKVFSISYKNWKEGDLKVDETSSFDSFNDYLELGFKHILSGFDHLAFLLALLVLNLKIRKLIMIVTGFTIGHSITLALGSLNLIQPSSQLVEALIGYSIIIIAIECVASISNNHKLFNHYLVWMWALLLGGIFFFGNQKFLIGLLGVALFSYCYFELSSRYKEFSLTILVTCLFGLVHGFGFAGNLSTIGLMEDRLLPAIFGFNLGVELGQILVLIVLTSALFFLKRIIDKDMNDIRVYIASGLSCVGMFWFLERLF